MSDRTGTGATLSIGHKGAIYVTALAAGRRSSIFAPPPLRPKFLLSATSRYGRPTFSSEQSSDAHMVTDSKGRGPERTHCVHIEAFR
jgi:hypothetical protein